MDSWSFTHTPTKKKRMAVLWDSDFYPVEGLIFFVCVFM